mmetsp:Transcript_14339/g.60659  ORF Transcript_14339/g.60659 Transcript_14339/m.60659 type:complete len:202 (+) Transcript_14339:1810-2415(+)
MTLTRAYGPSARPSHPGTCPRPPRWPRRTGGRLMPRTTRTSSEPTLAEPPQTPGTPPTTKTRTEASRRAPYHPIRCPRPATRRGMAPRRGPSPRRLSARGRTNPIIWTWLTRMRTGASWSGFARCRGRRSWEGSRRPRVRAPPRVPRSAPRSTPSRRARRRRRLCRARSSRTSPPTRARRWRRRAPRRRRTRALPGPSRKG